MAPPKPKLKPKPKQRKVRLPENEEVAAKLLEKHRSMMEQPGALSDNQKLTLAAAHRNVCAAKEPIRTLGDLARTKGIGDWVIGLMKGSLPDSVPALSPPKGKKRKQTKRYVPQKNSAPYAILITLYRKRQ